MEISWDSFTLDAPSCQKLPEDPQEVSGKTWSIALDGRRIPFRYLKGEKKKRPTLLCFHGLGLQIGSFYGIGRYLFEAFDLLLPDYTSFSAPAGWPVGGITPLMLAQVAWRIADELKLERLAFTGSSLGGGLALLAAQSQPARTDRLVLFNPACFPQRLPRTYRLVRVPILGELFAFLARPQWMVKSVEEVGYVDASRFSPALRAHYFRNINSPQARQQMIDLIRMLPGQAHEPNPYGPDPARIAAPVLVVWGLQDRLLTQGAGERLARQLPRGDYLPLAHLAHLPHEEEPERLGPVALAFLNRG